MINRYTTHSTQTPVYTSRAPRCVTVGRPDTAMSYGDRMTVRVVMGNSTLMEYETRNVADMTDLTGDLRRRAHGRRGLATVYIRNHDRGWTRERRMMLYPERKFAPTRRVEAVQVPMFFPWEL